MLNDMPHSENISINMRSAAIAQLCIYVVVKVVFFSSIFLMILPFFYFEVDGIDKPKIMITNKGRSLSIKPLHSSRFNQQ